MTLPGPRARDLGIVVGALPTAPLNALTDVPDVRVGHTTLIEGDRIRTGVTAILPHAGNPYLERVPAAVAVGNGYGKFAGSTQLDELGELESPILLTNTLAVGAVLEGGARWLLDLPGNEDVRSVNVVVGETNDGLLNDIRSLPVRPEHAINAIRVAAPGAFATGSVGAGTGTQAFGWKGGIGTSSRCVRTAAGPVVVGVLVQTNFGGLLTIGGVPVWRHLGRTSEELDLDCGDGSVIFVVATNAPVCSRNLARMARRAFLGLARTGSPMTNGSGDYAIAFSTHPDVRRMAGARLDRTYALANSEMSTLFQAVTEAAEESIYDAMFTARTLDGHRGRLEAIPTTLVRDSLQQAWSTQR